MKVTNVYGIISPNYSRWNNNINDYSNYNNCLISDNGQNIHFTGKKDAVISFFKLNPILHFKKFSVDEYKNLSNREIERLRAGFEKSTHEYPRHFLENIIKLHKFAVDNLEKAFNEEFGKGNYTVIVIGRSFSSIGKVLGYRIGENNVKNIPMSFAQKYNRYLEIDIANKEGEINKLLEYLKSIGLDKETIEKSDKNFIFIDYCNFGDSLKGAENLFTSKYVYGEQKNVFFRDALETFPVCQETRIIRTYMHQMEFKDFSFVRRAENLKRQQKAVKNPLGVQNKVKYVWFKLLDNEMQNQRAI